MKKIFGLIFAFFTISVTAQDSTKTEETSGSSYFLEDNFLKNEFGISFDPILISLLGGSVQNNNARAALTYRRHLNEKWSFRMVGALISDMNYDDDFSDYDESYNSDSTLKYKYYSGEDQSRGFAVNSGIQFNWGKKKLKWFAGADLVYHRYKKELYTIKYTYALDTLDGSFYFQDFENTYRNEHMGDRIGIFPFIGIRAMFSKHWGFSTHFGVSMEYGFEKYSVYNYSITPTDINIYKSTSFNMESYALFQDVSLIFRF